MILRYDEYLIERVVTNINNDVDYLYSFFKEDIEQIAFTGYIKEDMFTEKHTLYSSDLKSELSMKAHAINPCKIFINHNHTGVSTNAYSPKGSHKLSKDMSFINLSIHQQAKELILKNYGGDVDKANSDYPGIANEFKDYKIRGSIRHELTHWYDDTFHGDNIKKTLKSLKQDSKKYFKKNKIDSINAAPFEIYAVLQNIYEAKQKFETSWDHMTFDDMVDNLPPLKSIRRTMKDDTYKKWKSIIKGKMYRNELLGKNMVNT